MPRVPESCPAGFQGRYTVQPGDSMFSIAQRFGVSLNALIAANPHISNPALIFPGDVLCVPGTQGGRVPTSCPPGFQCRYTVQPGDSMFSIAQAFGVPLNALIAANPHISNPNLIFPGDVLCVPCEETIVPCTLQLNPRENVITDIKGAALVRFLSTNQRSVSVLATSLPQPSALGDFNAYEAVVSFPPPESAQFEILLSPTPSLPGQPITWSGTLNFAVGNGFPSDTMILVRPLNTNTGATGSVILTGTLARCCR